ncbi:hypothetical protein M885DRAFT_507172 [Pelagophyceae sp. CCMP2097]|nr:hypothetical protein M885DRAFT_507172 [Pelagophyceae sp. CCMP2097]
MPRAFAVAALALARFAAVADEQKAFAWPFFAFNGAQIDQDPNKCSDAARISLPAAAVALAYRNNQKMPPGCTCRKTGDTDRECTLFDCDCICDLTAGECDQNCCCDGECSEAQKSRFDDMDACVAEGPTAPEITKCYTTKGVDSINPTFPMTAKGTAKSSVDRLLCVRYDNSDQRGAFYKDPGSPAASVFDSAKGQKNYDFAALTTASKAYVAPDSVYDAGDVIKAAFELDGDNRQLNALEIDQGLASSSDGYIAAYRGAFPLPAADSFGECDDGAAAMFGSSRVSKCQRSIPAGDLERACDGGLLGSLRFVNVKMGRMANTQPSGGTWVDVRVNKVTYVDFYDATQKAGYSQFDASTFTCDASYGGDPNAPTVPPTQRPTERPTAKPTQRPTPQPSLPPTPQPSVTAAPTAKPTPSPSGKPSVSPTSGKPSATPTPEPSAVLDVVPTPAPVGNPTFSPSFTLAPTRSCSYALDSALERPALPVCRNALVEACYTVVYDPAGFIVSASVDVVLTDVPDDGAAVVLEQTFLMQFASTFEVPRSRDIANLVNRSRSGNPGYIVGRPLLSGLLGATTVAQRADGLRVLGSTGRGECSAKGVGLNGVAFGSDLRSGCSLVFSRSDLRDFCFGEGPHAAGNGVPTYFNVSNIFTDPSLSDDVIGLFGNADPVDASQWLPIATKAAGGNDASWDERQGKCSDAVVVMNLRFLWAYVGSHSNPQAKIIAARVDFGKDDWAFGSDGLIGETQHFGVSNTVTFVQVSQGFDSYSPPSPPIAVSVPYDVWYPFKIDSHAKSLARPALSLFLVACAALALLASDAM